MRKKEDGLDLVSVIIPVYNTGKYLRKCLGSVTGQTFSDLEIILVDDGSADDSYEICRDFAEKDRRIRLIQTENKGAAAARRTAMAHSAGKYIVFVDSDDWIEADMIERLWKEITREQVDIVISGYIESGAGEEKVIRNRLEAGVYREKQLEVSVFPRMLCAADFFEMGIQPFLWNKLYKREIIEPHIMSLDERVAVGEDVLCIFPAILQAKAVSIMNEGFYHYRFRQESAMRTHRSEEDEIRNIRIQYSELKKAFEKSRHADCLLRQLERYIVHHLLVRVPAYAEAKMQEKNESVFEKSKPDGRILIYGAGTFGKEVYRFWKQRKNDQIAGWCDRNYEKLQGQGYPVISPEDAMELNFDAVVVAVLNKDVKNQVARALEKRIGGKEIIWLNERALTKKYLPEQILN